MSQSGNDTGMPEKKNKRRFSMARMSDVKINIRIESPQQTYTTNDVIHGEAIVQSSSDVQFEDIRIELVGTSRALIERWTATPGYLPYTEAAQDFLRLSQPGIECKYPADRTLKAGERYTFGFTFVIPKHLSESVCKHALSDSSVRDAHIALLPSLGRSNLRGMEGVVEDMAHPKASVSYGIFVSVTQEDQWPNTKVLARESQGLRIIPTVAEWSGPDVVRLLRDGPKSRYCLRKEEAVKGGILRKRLGTLAAEAEVPNSVRLPSTVSLRDPCRATTMATVKLRFDAAKGFDQAPPRLDKVTSKLTIRTDISSTPCTDFPQDADVLYDARKSRRNDFIELASLGLSGVEWQAADARPGRLGSDQTWSSASSVSSHHGKEAGIFETEIVVPISLPENKAFVPTFHSCYISRTYALNICVSYSGAGTSGSVNLCLPLQVTAGSLEEQSAPSDNESWILPDYDELRPSKDTS